MQITDNGNKTASWIMKSKIPTIPFTLNWATSNKVFNFWDLKSQSRGTKGQNNKLNPGNADTMLEN